MRKKNRPSFVLILIAALFAVSLLLPIVRGSSPIDFGLDLSGGVRVTYRPDFSSRLESHAEVPRAELLALAKETLASRLYRSLSTVPDVVVRGDETIVVSIPGVEDHRQVLELVGKTYRLTLRLVAASHDVDVDADVEDRLFGYGERQLELEPAEFSGDMLDERHIQVETGLTGELEPGSAPRVGFRFRPPHDQAFARFTGEHIGRELAILLDDEVEWCGRIESVIRGSGVLRGAYTLEQATDVARMLRSGSLPVSLEVESVTGIGPSLGQEIRELGFSALLLSIAMLVAVLLAAYLHRTWFLLAGVLSLFFLLLYISGTVAVFGLTLDIAGIAGLVLSVGMGMDAFILILEALDRKLGAFTPRQLADHHDRIVRGLYSFAQEGRVLFHANATTAVVLMLLLTGERLRSFALFIFVGIFASVLTIFTTRELLKRTYGLLPDSGVDLLGWLRGKSLGVFRLRRPYFALVATALALTGCLLVVGGPASFELGADFEEGTQLIVESRRGERLQSALLRLEERLPGVEIRHQSLGAPADGRTLVTLGSALGGEQRGGSERQATRGQEAVTADSGALTVEQLVRLLAAESVELESVSSIDSRVSSDRLLRSLAVFILSFFLLALYFVVLQGPINGVLAGRSARPLSAGSRLLIFSGILLAVVVDVAVILMVLALSRIEIGLPVVAAILTVIGYSVNDSVVLWSHVRNRHRAAKKSCALELVTGSVDSILSRALLTSLSTMVPALAILIVGLRPLEGFAWVMIVGTLAGTLSSIFVVGSFAVRVLERESRFAAPSSAAKPVRAAGLSRGEIARRLQEVE